MTPNVEQDLLHDPLTFLQNSIQYRESLGFRVKRIFVSPELLDLAIWDVYLLQGRSIDSDEALENYEFRIELDKTT